MLLTVSLKLLLPPVMMILKADRISPACGTRGYFRGGCFEDPEAGTQQTLPCLACRMPNQPPLRGWAAGLLRAG